MKIKKIYLDMDGVLSDFHRRYSVLYGEAAPGEDRSNKLSSNNWKHFVVTRQFETLDWFQGAQDILEFVQMMRVPVEILSSAGGAKYHSEVREQKLTWLKSKNIVTDSVNIVPGRRVKRFYAFSGNVLIDDTPDVIEEFNKYGGIGILHTNVNDTINQLKELMK